MTEKHLLTIKSIFLLIGSFIFAFLFGEMVHEFGHYLAHQAYGNTGVGVVLDPFGGTHISGVTVKSLSVMAVTSAAGPLLNVVLGLSCFLLLMRIVKFANPRLLKTV